MGGHGRRPVTVHPTFHRRMSLSRAESVLPAHLVGGSMNQQMTVQLVPDALLMAAWQAQMQQPPPLCGVIGSSRMPWESSLAEGEGFEPPWGLRPPLISSQGRLAAPASLRFGLAPHYRYSAPWRQVECSVSSCSLRISRKPCGSVSTFCSTASPVAEQPPTTPPAWSPLSEAFS